MENLPLVSVVVLNFNGLRYLERGLKECLDSVLETDYPNLEVIFVDNGSSDGSPDFVRQNFKESEIKVIINKHNIIAEGYNRGIKASRGKYIALLSNDMIFEPDWLRQITKLMEREPQIGIAGGKRMLYGTSDIIDGIGNNLCLCGRTSGVGKFEIDRGQYNTVRDDLDYIGGAVVVARKVLHEIGLFDPDYIIFFEDVELCFRIRKQGYKVVYVPDAVLWHKRFQTIQGIDPVGHHMEYMSYRSRIRFVIIHFVIIRILSTLVIDLASLMLSNPVSKRLFLKAYWWNLKNIGTTLKRRKQYGPSPSRCKFPIIYFHLSDVLKRLREIIRHKSYIKERVSEKVKI